MGAEPADIIKMFTCPGSLLHTQLCFVRLLLVEPQLVLKVIYTYSLSFLVHQRVILWEIWGHCRDVHREWWCHLRSGSWSLEGMWFLPFDGSRRIGPLDSCRWMHYFHSELWEPLTQWHRLTTHSTCIFYDIFFGRNLYISLCVTSQLKYPDSVIHWYNYNYKYSFR